MERARHTMNIDYMWICDYHGSSSSHAFKIPPWWTIMHRPDQYSPSSRSVSGRPGNGKAKDWRRRSRCFIKKTYFTGPADLQRRQPIMTNMTYGSCARTGKGEKKVRKNAALIFLISALSSQLCPRAAIWPSLAGRRTGPNGVLPLPA